MFYHVYLLPHIFHIFQPSMEFILSKVLGLGSMRYQMIILWGFMKKIEFIKTCQEKCCQHLWRLEIQISTIVLPHARNSLFVMCLKNQLIKFKAGTQCVPLQLFPTYPLCMLQCTLHLCFTVLFNFSNSYFPPQFMKLCVQYQYARVAITKYYRMGIQQQKCVFSQVWSLEVKDQDV